MGDVVSFERKPEELVWVCECGCSTHQIYTTGALECASCGNIASVSGGEWVRELPEPVAEPQEKPAHTKVISLSGSPKQALQSMLRRVDPETMVALIAIQENGRVRTWGGIDTPERAEWLDRRLEEARELLVMLMKDEDKST